MLRPVFRDAADLLRRCQDEVPDFEGRTLSMGMSNDYEIAVAEGATLVRIGRAIFPV